MQKAFPLLLQISLFTLGCLLSTSKVSIAQVTSDGTVNTQVTQNGNVAEITGGETRGGNLFHSFQDFSVSTGNEAAFLNANDIANIFSRVT
ncbi:MAG: filamentous hemagglutinin N-terminal domain-containing protein, partial [Waterburya sp.]